VSHTESRGLRDCCMGNVGGVFHKEGTEVPLPLCGGQGQVMCTRERVGLPGMACALGGLGVQGSLAVTLNQNRRLPFERLEGRQRGERINTKVGCGVLQGLEAQQNSLTPALVFEREKGRGCDLVTFPASCCL